MITSQSRIEQFMLDSHALRDNPLGDPHVRPITVYLPPGHDDMLDRRYPTIYLLSSHGSTGPSLVNWRPWDVTIQAQVLEMIQQLKGKFDTSVVMITHDLGVVAVSCNSVAVVYAGEIVEYGTAEHIFDHPTHPYTIGLFNSLPKLDSTSKRLKPIKGMMPNMAKLPKGCKFCPRCSSAMDQCAASAPETVEVSPGHQVKCFLAGGE